MKIVFTVLALWAMLSVEEPSSFGKDYDYVEQLFDVRGLITDHGKLMPSAIKETTGNDLRTLERIFELNTSTLTTIEAYFRILMITLSTKSETNEQAVKILNEWLTFTNNQCAYDIEYLDSTLAETSDDTVIEQIQTAKHNAQKLSEILQLGIKENLRLLISKPVKS
ncbi:MAG: hypothetical protein ABH844_04985 [Candidatus Omnitrophota bacterium]